MTVSTFGHVSGITGCFDEIAIIWPHNRRTVVDIDGSGIMN